MRVWALLFLTVLCSGAAHSETVRIGTSASYPPVIVHNGAPPVSGLEGDLMAAICAGAGWTCTWEFLPFDAIFDALEAGRIDISANSLGRTAERAARVHMTCPYRPNSAEGAIGTFYVTDPSHDPMRGPVSVLRDTLHASALGEAGVDARQFSADAAAINALIAGDVRAYFGGEPAIESHPDRGQLIPAGELALDSGGTSLAASPLRPDLAATLDAQLVTLSRDGTITRLTTRWTGSGVDDPIALCDIGLPIS